MRLNVDNNKQQFQKLWTVQKILPRSHGITLTKSFCQCDAGHQTVDFLYHDTNENNQMSSR